MDPSTEHEMDDEQLRFGNNTTLPKSAPLYPCACAVLLARLKRATPWMSAPNVAGLCTSSPSQRGSCAFFAGCAYRSSRRRIDAQSRALRMARPAGEERRKEEGVRAGQPSQTESGSRGGRRGAPMDWLTARKARF